MYYVKCSGKQTEAEKCVQKIYWGVVLGSVSQRLGGLSYCNRGLGQSQGDSEAEMALLELFLIAARTQTCLTNDFWKQAMAPGRCDLGEGNLGSQHSLGLGKGACRPKVGI